MSLVSWKPKKIIFVDNYLYNVESVGDALKNLDISFEGIYFTFVNDESDKYSEQKIDATSNCLMNFEAQLEQCIFNE